ncbi:MAG: cation transporter [Clostridia bacterium]|nr:cation transporter [Clostridia bacterium]
MNREKEIVKTSIVGILVNILLVGFKAFIGFLASSVSIIMDAVNNLTDALSSLITIVGTKLANKKPTKSHPYGYGRIEYITSTLISFIILFAGITAIYESVLSWINHQTPSYDKWALIIVGVAVLVKIGLGLFFRLKAKAVDSDALKSSGTDALFDSILSLSTLIAVVISLTLKVYVETYLGILIGLFIVKSGVEALKESLSHLIGNRIEKDKSEEIRNLILSSHKEVSGVYDLVINNYGPNKSIGSVHIEIPDNFSAKDIQFLERQIQIEIYTAFSIIMTVGIYAANDSTAVSKSIKENLLLELKNYESIVQMHGFYVDEIKKVVFFDLIFDFEEKDPHMIIDNITSKMKEKFPDFFFNVVLDTDFSD